MKIHFFPVCLIVAVFGDELAADAYRVVNSAELISLYDENDAVIELTNKNITQVLMNPTQVWYIEFYMHWCGHCQKFSPLWKELANQFDGKEKIIPRYIFLIFSVSPEKNATYATKNSRKLSLCISSTKLRAYLKT